MTSTMKSNRNYILVSAIIALICLTYGISNFDRAFPEFSINMQISKEEALQNARSFLESRHFDLTGYHESVIFSSNSISLRYLERELGVQRATTLAQDSVDIWHWQVRFFKPLDPLEYSARISTNGKVIGFNRVILEKERGPSLDPNIAQKLAEAFLKSHFQLEFENWEFVEVNSSDKPERRDHHFTFEKRDFRAADAPLRLRITVQGAQIGGFSQYLKVPQAWQRDFDRQQSRNMLFHTIARLLAGLMVIGMFYHFFVHIRDGQVPWRITIILASILAGANFLLEINALPVAMSGYRTTETYSVFLGMRVLRSLMLGIMQGMSLMVLIGSGEYLYRKDFPGKLALQNILRWRGFQSREFIQATLMGYILVAIDIGFVVFYYVVGQKIGFWSPARIEYTNTVSTFLPWLYPLVISLSAALLEEFYFRFYGISLFRKLLKNKTAAIVLTALIWGFLHSNYPQQPAFARGFEVTIVGILAGIVFLRFGIWSVLVWHFVIDAILIGLFLFRSDNTYFWISGLIICGALAIPAVIAGIMFLLRRSFVPVSDLNNSSFTKAIRDELSENRLQINRSSTIEGKKTLVKKANLEEFKPESTFLTNRSRKIALICGIIGILTVFLPDQPILSDNFSPLISRSDAIEKARNTVEEKYGISTENYIISVIDDQYMYQTGERLQTFLSKLSYVYKYGTIDDAQRIFLSDSGVNFFSWYIAFKREFDPEEFTVVINQSSGVTHCLHTLSDSSRGSTIEQDSARVLAEAAFCRIESSPELFKVISEKVKQQDSRLDYAFTWESIEPAIEDAHYRRTVSVKGDEVNHSNRYLKVPEEWLRFESEKTLRYFLMLTLNGLVIIGGGLICLIAVRRRWGRFDVRWKNGLVWCGLVFLIDIIGELNTFNSNWWNYATSNPSGGFITSTIIEGLISSFAITFTVLILYSLTEALAKKVFGFSPLSVTIPKSGKINRLSDMLITLIGTLGVLSGINWLLDNSTIWFGLPVHSFQLEIVHSLSAYLPWLSEFLSAFTGALFISLIAMLAYIMLAKGITKTWIRWLILVLSAVGFAGVEMMGLSNPSNSELLWGITRLLILLAVGYYVMTHWIKGRMWLLMIVIYLHFILNSFSQFSNWEESAYQSQSLILVALTLIPFIILGIHFFNIREHESINR